MARPDLQVLADNATAADRRLTRAVREAAVAHARLRDAMMRAFAEDNRDLMSIKQEEASNG